MKHLQLCPQENVDLTRIGNLYCCLVMFFSFLENWDA